MTRIVLLRNISALAVSLAACAPALSQTRQSSTWLRALHPFEVRDSTGTPLAHPFTGGYNVPRPQLADIDGDGDYDLFIQERTNDVTFFERTGTGAAGTWTWRTDRYQDLDVGEWFRLTDIDGDGDLDILAEERFSYIRIYRNEGGRAAPRFIQVPDSLREASGAALFADRQNIPNLTDIDCNGKLDLFIGRVTGTVDRYEAAGTDRHGLPMFGLVTQRFENIEIIGDPTGSRHGANTLAFADYDADGDEDLFWGDFFEPGLLLIENTGTCAAPNLRNEPVRFPVGNPLLTSGYNAPAFADLDQDGDLDLLMGVIGGAFVPARTAVENLYLVEQTAPRQFSVRTRRFITALDVGTESAPALGDLDGDGDLDLLVANKLDPDSLPTSLVHYFENTGSRTRPSFQDRGTLPAAGTFHQSPALGDLDGDGDLDLVVGTWQDVVHYYRKDPAGFTLADTALVRLTRGSNAFPALGDLDGDGDLDLLVGEGSGALNFYRNTGTRTAAVFTLESDEWLGIDPGRRSAPSLVDIDSDGDLDLLLGSEAEGVKLYRNTGTRAAPQFTLDEPFRVQATAYATAAAGDLDGDGRPEILVGGAGGGLMYFSLGGD